jgi:hypothetical protein
MQTIAWSDEKDEISLPGTVYSTITWGRGNHWDLAKAQLELAKLAKVTKHEQRPNVNIFDDLRT